MTKPLPTVQEQANTLRTAAEDVATRFWETNDLTTADPVDAATFGFLMGTIHGAVLHDVVDHKELREVVYQVLRDRFHFTDEDIAIDIIGG